MSAASMIEDKICQREDAAGNHIDTRLMRDYRLFLESVSFELEKEYHRLARGLKAVNSFRIVENMENKRIMEVEQVKEMNLDHNTTEHHQYDEFEQY